VGKKVRDRQYNSHGQDGLWKSGSISPREKEVLKWIIEGKTNWEIGVILHISERTVKFHVQNLMKKLRATNRYHIVAKALSAYPNGVFSKDQPQSKGPKTL